MSCGFWIKRKKRAAKQREQERLKAELAKRKAEPVIESTETVETVEESTEMVETVEESAEPAEKRIRKRATKNADSGTA